MAEVTTNKATSESEASVTEQTNESAVTTTESQESNVEQLMAELAAAKAENARNKAALDKTLKEKGELTKSLRAKQTAEEQAAADKQAEDERRQAEYESAINELNRMKATQAYSTILTEKNSVDNVIAAAGLNADHSAIAAIIDVEKKAAVKAARAEWQKSVSPVQVGSGAYSGLTKQQIMNITDRSERRRAIAENQELFQ